MVPKEQLPNYHTPHAEDDRHVAHDLDWVSGVSWHADAFAGAGAGRVDARDGEERDVRSQEYSALKRIRLMVVARDREEG